MRETYYVLFDPFSARTFLKAVKMKSYPGSDTPLRTSVRSRTNGKKYSRVD